MVNSYVFGSDVWPGAAKVIEEAGELLQVLGKLMYSKDQNKIVEKLVEEIGDLEAALHYFITENSCLSVGAIEERITMKLSVFQELAKTNRCATV